MSGIEINHPSDDVPEGEQTWDTETLQRDFEVKSFLAPFVLVRRKEDGRLGTLKFSGGGGEPRVYHSFWETP